jgi:8-oxo-dGTP pyrophosphatase MutT (NUDIX family)
METKTGTPALDLPAVERILQGIDPVNRPPGQHFDPTVVFLLLFGADHPHILAVLKSDTEGYPWRNQVALPGGHVDEGDATTLDAAYRELEEELAIFRADIRVIGSLGHFQTINNKDIEVFTGVWNGRGDLRFDTAEIARVLPLPLVTLLEVHRARGYHGRLPGVHELVYPVNDVRIWGVTGKILHFFLEHLHPAVWPRSFTSKDKKKDHSERRR